MRYEVNDNSEKMSPLITQTSTKTMPSNLMELTDDSPQGSVARGQYLLGKFDESASTEDAVNVSTTDRATIYWRPVLTLVTWRMSWKYHHWLLSPMMIWKHYCSS